MQIYLHLPNEGKKLLCNEGDNVRKTLLKHGVSPYRGFFKLGNCRGNGMCGSCRVQIEPSGHVREEELTGAERVKLKDHPGWRLACQLHAMRDLIVWTQPGKAAGAKAPDIDLYQSLDASRKAAAEKRGPREERKPAAPKAASS
jgi:ferredoxin